MPLPVAFLLSKQNRTSIAALLAVLERELGPEVEPSLLASAEDWDGSGLLVFSFMTAAAARAQAELRGVMERFGADACCAAGGSHPSGDPAGTRELGFRWVFTGEAGPAFAALVRSLCAGEVPAPGIRTETAELPLDTYPPWPDSGELFSSIELTRGCPMQCTFCQTPRLFGRRPRHRSLEALSKVFTHARSTGHRYTRFVAPNAFGYGSADGIQPDLGALHGVVETARRAGLERVYLGTFPSEVRPESVTPETLAFVRDHCDNRALAVGLQSGSERMLKLLRRGHTVKQGLEAVERIAAFGLEPKVDFIFGLPDETGADRADTLEVIERLVGRCGARVHAHLFHALPGTPLAGRASSPLDARTLDRLGELAGLGIVTGFDGRRAAAAGSAAEEADGTPDGRGQSQR